MLLLISVSGCNQQFTESTVQANEKPVVKAEAFMSLQDALDALPETGGVVELAAEVYEIDEPLVVSKGDVLIRGVGTASNIVNKNEDGEPAFILSSGNKHEKRKNQLQSLWRIQFSDLRITGNEKSGHGIHADFINEIFLDGVTLSYHGGHGVYLNFCYEDARINDCLITYNKKSGVHAVGCHDTIISGTQFEENFDAVEFIDGFNLTATGNNVDDHLRHGFVVKNSMGNTISSNMIEQCVGVGVVLEDNTYATTIGSNIFTADKLGGVILRDVHGSTITGNTFTILPVDAVSIDSKSRAITVSGNTFANRNVGETEFKGQFQDNVASGIVLNSTMLHTISGNTFSNLDTKAIEIIGEPSQRILFSNNVLINTESDHDQLKDSLVENNLVHVDTAEFSSQAIDLPEKKNVHLYLLIGQSNMAGRGVMKDIDRRPVPGILKMNSENQWVMASHPLHFDKPKYVGTGMGLSFANEMQKQNSDVVIGLIPCAVGGTPLSRWGRDGDLYQAALKRAKIALKDGELKGIVWHQGEADSKEDLAGSYAVRLKAAIENWREDLESPDIPFVAGELCENWVAKEDENKYRSKVMEQMNLISSLDENAACVSSKGLKPKPDGIHFSRDALIEFGKRYAKSMIELQKKNAK